MAEDLFATVWESVVETTSYLLAYNYALVLAPLAHLVLVALDPRRRGWLGERRGPGTALVLGLTEPLSRAAFADNLGRLRSPGAVVTYLGVSHALSLYTWVLMGPLLGKDFLVSHVIGTTLFVLVATTLLRAAGVSFEPRRAGGDEHGEQGTAERLGGAAVRFVALASWGLLLGSLVAAWGFSSDTWAPAEIGAGGWWTQSANGGIGLALALVGVPPVANLFVATYLWKVGLAQAGIVAYFAAATAAPTRWRLYRSLYGRRGATRLVACLLVAALVAGLATAWLYGSIRYKLLPSQLWELSR